LSRAFAGLGDDCALAGTAGDACGEVHAFRRDVVLLDWVFHDASGIGLAQKLRKDAAASGHRFQIVVLSV
jgi:DNA-binding response OmpR family regulator